MHSRLIVRAIVALVLIRASACGGSAPPASDVAVARRPSDVYTAYLSAIANAGSISEVIDFLSSAGKQRVGNNLEALKAKTPGGVLKILDEQVAGNRATLTINATIASGRGKELPATGTVVLVREDGAWKVDQETWKAKE